jgi:2-dehydropantoate 2-reductase
MLQAEGRALYDERGIGYASTDELARRERGVLTRYDVGGSRPGGSVWQSVTRAQPTEVDYLCGEIVRLARVAGLRAPANALLQRRTHEVASGELGVGAIPEATLIAQLAAVTIERTHRGNAARSDR